MSSVRDDTNLKVYVAGHNGMVGSAIVRELKSLGYKNIITRSHSELDLINQQKVENFFKSEKPDIVYLAAAKVGGIHANNTFPADFIYQNLMIQTNVIHQSFLNGVKRLLFLGSSCIYPRSALQPMPEEALLTGKLDPTNEPYAIAKISGIKLCESYNRQFYKSNGIDYRCVMPTNLYGPGDNYHPENSHVIPGLIRRFHDAKKNNLPKVMVWGSGSPLREFMYVDDMASACVYVMSLSKETYDKFTNPMQYHLNVGVGEDITIRELATMIGKVVEYTGKIEFDTTMPEGAPRKLMNGNRLGNLGWVAKVKLNTGLQLAYKDFTLKHY